KNRLDAYGPFIRVTNSYNGLRALAFDIGFYRKVCRNGLIVPNTVMRFKVGHGHHDLGRAPQFDIDPEKVSKLKTAFGRYAEILGTLRSPRHRFEPLMPMALSIRTLLLPARDDREAEERRRLAEVLLELSDRYAGALGENGYAAFNAIPDFASHPPKMRLIARERQ